MHYQLYYWTGLQGRGEFVRLALEDAGAAYTDVARTHGDEVMTEFLEGGHVGAQPFAPPFLKAGDIVVAQVAAILHFIGPQLQLVTDSEPQRLQALQLQMTIADLVAEVHDTHHPIATGLYYEDQQAEAAKRAQDLCENRLPKFLGYFEQVLQQSGGMHVLGTHSYVDLSLFQMISGLEYMFPKRMTTLATDLPGLMALQQRVAKRPRIAAYLASERRVAFNTNGIFRHYPELDAA
ncbi:glutathione S-transferase [Xanthomonas vasicola]|uniref:Glutathione S-transferase n=1 Tax=Xanthomonas vasicola TaxID=56459 RepID=A0ABD7S6F2_XANVA|nr:glutathione S-transferase [Xanthomonas vasicola]AZR23762.1 glutathione S-transferase [Xanthomonas vasicola]KGR38330.1 glutathione S-transferase [Xanthomonas vasicola]KGR38519.1 glutathione S-transferase [Xanthomonas vasicola]KGR58228.1 glutathione S-transferase [Xanthomonas vasicola]MDO6986384.1 glutathione S-transferase [Xanthomonas vasicola]